MRALPRPTLLAAILGAWIGAGCVGVGGSARPDYVGALVELRSARQLLEEPASEVLIAEEGQAVLQIDTAVALIHQRVEKHGPAGLAGAADPAADRVERVHYALQHLDAARLLLTREEYDAERHALRNEAISCIARAEEALGRTLESLLR